jgi:hypothetical protein
MADLGKNSLWTNLSNKADSVETEILGPDYSYSDNIAPPQALGVGTNGSFGQLITNSEAIESYVKTLITGDPPLGNQYFVNTGGMCTATDGSLQPRHNYINNMSSGAADLPAGLQSMGGDFNGLIPGVVGDIEGLNPMYLFSSLTADGNPPCDCYACPVSSGGLQDYFLTPELTPDLEASQCMKVDPQTCIQNASNSTDSFSNRKEDSYFPLLVAGACFLLLVFSGKK